MVGKHALSIVEYLMRESRNPLLLKADEKRFRYPCSFAFISFTLDCIVAGFICQVRFALGGD